MQRLQAYKFEILPNGEQQRRMRRFAGSCRVVVNKALALQKQRCEPGEKKLSYAGLCTLLTQWRNGTETPWLADARGYRVTACGERGSDSGQKTRTKPSSVKQEPKRLCVRLIMRSAVGIRCLQAREDVNHIPYQRIREPSGIGRVAETARASWTAALRCIRSSPPAAELCGSLACSCRSTRERDISPRTTSAPFASLSTTSKCITPMPSNISTRSEIFDVCTVCQSKVGSSAHSVMISPTLMSPRRAASWRSAKRTERGPSIS